MEQLIHPFVVTFLSSLDGTHPHLFQEQSLLRQHLYQCVLVGAIAPKFRER